MIDDQYIQKKVLDDLYPQGDEVNKNVRSRRRFGSMWRTIFVGATILAVIILAILLLKILNDAFGYVAEESRYPERELILDYNREQVLNAPNILLATEDDPALAAAVADEPNGLGFLPWSAFQTQSDRLNLVAVDGVLPSAETVVDESYPFARPLFVYTTRATVDQKPQVRAFLTYYLQNLDEVVPEAGYFLADQEALVAQTQGLLDAFDLDAPPAINPADYEGDIVISGSSTVFPITQAMADRFIAEGFRGTITVNPAGTSAGFRQYCVDNNRSIDIVNASRPVLPTEFGACRQNQRSLEELVIAQDALSVVVNFGNDFATNVTQEQVLGLFTAAQTWSDVDAAWPSETIHRFIPSADSGTMDFFVEEVYHQGDLFDMSYESLVSIYTANVSRGRCRAVEREQRFFVDSLVCEDPAIFAEVCASDNPPTGCVLEPRDSAEMVQLIRADVVRPQIKGTWNALESVLRRDEILAEAAVRYPTAEVYFKSWLTRQFILSPQSSFPEIAGIRTAILGTIWVVGIAILFSFPLGVGAAVYLEEYADKTSRLNQIIQTNINNLAGVPSIIYGLLGLAVFVRVLEPITSGYIFGVVDSGTTANGRTILSAGLTLGLLGLPVIIISAQEAIRAVPSSLRQASYGLGATKWETVRSHVLPNAIGGILTGVILSTSRIIGETAPLVVIGASTFITTDPTGPFSKFTVLPVQIYQWTARPQDAYRDIAAATIIMLLLLLFMLNAVAIYLRNRYSKRMG
jgi:phosphate transport system permease protein